MIRYRRPSALVKWTGIEFLQWLLALLLFFGLPWAHYRQVLAPQLAPIHALQTTFEEEWQQAVRRGEWEQWAGDAMARVKTAVHRTMEQQRSSAKTEEQMADAMSTDSLKLAMASVKSPPVRKPVTSKKAKSKHILLRVEGVGPDDVVWTALNDFYAAPYQWGGNTVFGVDCSGLVTQVFHRVGVSLPRTAQTQFDSHLGVYVGLNDLRPGDLVFFHTRTKPYVSHVGIYVGNNEFLHAPRTGRRVEITPITGFYRKRFIAGKRIIADPFERYAGGEKSS